MLTFGSAPFSVTQIESQELEFWTHVKDADKITADHFRLGAFLLENLGKAVKAASFIASFF